jgi:CRP-like cAMP-binding protein
MTLEEMERSANQLIERGETDLAIKQLYDLVLAWAKKKDFVKAEAWRDKIIEINPMALAEILGSDEVIVLEKASTIDYYHQKIWNNLYVALTQDEGNALYLKLKQREFQPDKILTKQGTINNTLFFIDSGQLKNIFSQGDKEIFLNDVGQGNTAGQDTFFSNSTCTSTVVTTSPVKLMFLSRHDLMELENQIPGISQKLKKFCSRLEAKNYNTLLKNKALERRQNERHKMSGKIAVQILDKNQKQIGPTFNGSMEDLSIGGASFFLNGSGKDVGRSLLGRKTILTIKKEVGPEIIFNGFILGAKYDQKSTYTINLRFYKTYTKAAVADIVAKSPPPALF